MNEKYQKYKKYYDKYREEHREDFKRWKKLWRIKNKEKNSRYNVLWRSKKRLGEDNKVLVSQLGGKCCSCGISEYEHIKKYKRSLGVHHKDRKGRPEKTPNNDRGNLSLMCLSCHMKEHRPGDIRWAIK